MDLDKLLKFVTDNAIDWLRVTYLTLLHPVSRFELQPTSFPAKSVSGIVGAATEPELWLNPKLITYAFFSAILGVTVNSLIPGKTPSPELAAAVIMVFFFWLLYAVINHVICVCMGSKARLVETISVSLQVGATMYVISSFLGLVGASIVSTPDVANLLRSTPQGSSIVADPVRVFFAVGTLLGTIYSPLALRVVHKLNWWRTAVVALLPSIFLLVSFPTYQRTGIRVPLDEMSHIHSILR